MEKILLIKNKILNSNKILNTDSFFRKKSLCI